MRGEVRAGRREGVAGGGANGVHGGRSDSRLGGQGTRGAHVEHVVHVRDAGRVEAQRLIERRRALPSRIKGGRAMRGEVCGPGGGRVWGGGSASGNAACTGGRPDSRLGGQGTRAERT